VSSVPQQAPGKQFSSATMIRTLGGIAMLSGFLVVLTFQLTLPRINENKRLAVERAVFKVIPGIASRSDFLLTEAGVTPVVDERAEGIKIFAGYDEAGTLKGVALEAAARGYQDVIRILYGYNPDCECITGITVLQSTETPGLGDKIAKDPEFLANFKALDARLNENRTGLLHGIETVKHGTKTQPWQIDSISGATVSSKAIGKMLDSSGQNVLPSLVKNIDFIRGNN